ncbi:hypothetical protein HPIN_05530 [Helicobacter pylori India7]|uniref:Uncharacterized protein n=1 Tax=Helicobacter pylori (strain India7) TaxID=907238 RepID=E8QH45_HELP7|nr:hypothetical protein HPIN_05530 [Helicobacter pylori India7]
MLSSVFFEQLIGSDRKDIAFFMHKRLYTKNFSQKTLLAITLLGWSRLNILLTNP